MLRFVLLLVAVISAALLVVVGFGGIDPTRDWQPAWVFLGVSLACGWAAALPPVPRR